MTELVQDTVHLVVRQGLRLTHGQAQAIDPGELLDHFRQVQGPGEIVVKTDEPMVGQQAGAAPLQGRQHVVRQGLGAEGGVLGATDVLAAREGDLVVKGRK